jgi:hypothetical protein
MASLLPHTKGLCERPSADKQCHLCPYGHITFSNALPTLLHQGDEFLDALVVFLNVRTPVVAAHPPTSDARLTFTINSPPCLFATVDAPRATIPTMHDLFMSECTDVSHVQGVCTVVAGLGTILNVTDAAYDLGVCLWFELPVSATGNVTQSRLGFDGVRYTFSPLLHCTCAVGFDSSIYFFYTTHRG